MLRLQSFASPFFSGFALVFYLNAAHWTQRNQGIKKAT